MRLVSRAFSCQMLFIFDNKQGRNGGFAQKIHVICDGTRAFDVKRCLDEGGQACPRLRQSTLVEVLEAFAADRLGERVFPRCVASVFKRAFR